MILNSPYITGSIIVTGNSVFSGSITVLGGVSGSSAVSASYAVSASFASNAVSASFASNAATATSASQAQNAVSSSFALNAATATSASQAQNAVSSSYASNADLLDGKNSTEFAITGSNTFTGTQYTTNTINPNGFGASASIYTDGGLRVTKDTYVSGTIYVNNLTVFGTQSISYVTSSQLNISTNIISVNTDTPSIRFGGLSVYDSGSTGLTGSMLWDSERDHWIYSNPSGSSYNSGMMISGPRNSGSLGTEQGTLNNVIVKGQGGDHVTSSQMTDDGTTVRIPGNLQVTGSVVLSSALTGTSATFSGDVIRTSSNVGGINEIAVINSATSGASSSRLRISTAFTGGTTLGDAYTQYTDNNNFNWSTGAGVTTSRDFVITNHFTLGTNVFFRLAASTGVATFNNNVNITNSSSDADLKIETTIANAGARLRLKTSTTEWYIYTNQTSSTLRFFNGDDRFILTTAGAATFSSSVTAGGKFEASFSNTNTSFDNNSYLRLVNTGTSTLNQRIDLILRWADGTYNGTGGISMIRESATARSGKLILQPIGSDGNNVEALTISSNGAATISANDASGNRVNPFNTLTITTDNPNIPYGFFGGSILFRNRSYTSGVVDSARIRSVIYDDGAPNNFGGGLWFETTPTPGGTLTPSLVINYQGRVGIGTSSPSDKLTIVGGNILVDQSSFGTAQLRVKGTGTTTGFDIQNSNNDGYLWNRDNGNMYFATNNTERMRITSGGKIEIGSASVSGEIVKVTGNSSLDNYISVYSGTIHMFLDADASNSSGITGTQSNHNLKLRTNGINRMNIDTSGNIGAPNSGTNIYNASDLRLKKNIITITNGLNKISALNPVKFNWIDGFVESEKEKDMLGFIAQEVQNAIPEAVEDFSSNSITIGETTIENPLRVNEKFIIPVLVKAIQELKAENDTLKEILQRNNII